MTNKKKLSIVFIVLAGIGWGTSPIFVHYLAPYGFTSQQMTAVRGTVSFLCMLAYVLITNRSLLKIQFKELLLCAAVGATLFGSAFCYYTAMQMTSASTAVVLMYTAPIYVMLFSVLSVTAFATDEVSDYPAITLGQEQVVNIETKEEIRREIEGIALFNDFETST